MTTQATEVRHESHQAAPPSGDEPREGLTFESLAALAFGVALIAIVIAVFAVGLAMRAIDDHRATPAAEADGGSSASVSLAEFAITPAPVEVGARGSLTVSNAGTVNHDLAVEGTDAATPELAPGDEALLDLSTLEPGTYTVYCRLPGHRDSGMEDQLTIK